MTILQAIILGLAQGITEFFPISSSAHLYIIPKLLGWVEPPANFDVVLHLATLLAIFIALRGEISTLVKEALRGSKTERRTLLYIAYATVPALVIGFFTEKYLDALRSIPLVATTLIFWGALLWAAQIISVRIKRTITSTTQITLGQALLIGCAQVLSFIPGTSRSGVTMTAAIALGADRPTAAVYSFLLGIPAIAAAGAAASLHVYTSGLGVPLPSAIVAFVVALVSGIFVIRLFISMVRQGGFTGFAMYRIVLGLFLLLFI